MIYFKGIVEKEVNGKKIFFRHDMGALTMLGDIQNIGVNEIIRDCMRAKLSTLASFLYAGAARYCNLEKKTIDFTMDDAVEWLSDDKIGFKATLDMVEDCFKSPKYEEKNGEATVKQDGALKTLSSLQSETVA
ncbi:MAG TPA: hypothetical protein VD884_13170 [Ohtaekwangia sp.]|nr:hypothetical protein [Ohtaekwangia sp.]